MKILIRYRCCSGCRSPPAHDVRPIFLVIFFPEKRTKIPSLFRTSDTCTRNYILVECFRSDESYMHRIRWDERTDRTNDSFRLFVDRNKLFLALLGMERRSVVGCFVPENEIHLHPFLPVLSRRGRQDSCIFSLLFSP